MERPRKKQRRRSAKPESSVNGETYEVHGTVTGRKGHPVRGARVVVWVQHIRKRKELAAGETSEEGRYHIRYQLPKRAPQPVLLVIEAVSESLGTPLLSPLTQAQPDLQIDLRAEALDTSEWATLVRGIEPLLEGLTLSQLVEDATHQDITFLARELGKDTETIMRVAVSARLETAFKIAAPAFYAFLRQRIPSALPSPLLDASQNFTLIAALIQKIGSLIFALAPDVQKGALTSAIALDYVGQQFTAQIPAIVAQLQSLRGTDLLNQPYLVGNTTLGQLLDVVTLPQPKQVAFAQALAASSQSMRNFWRTLGDGTHGFTAAEASGIERALSVGAFVKNYVPLVQTLVGGFTARTYKTLPDLARLTLSDWQQLVAKAGTPPGIDAAGKATPAEVFAAVIYTRVTRAYPTAALASRVSAGKFVPPAQQQPVVQFFQNNPGLELLKDNLPAYLKAQGDKAFTGISAQDRPTVVAHARSFQRMLRVAPNVDVAQKLLTAGIKSATQIASLGQQQFFTQAVASGLTKPEANQAYQVAAQRYASLVALYMRLNADSVGVLPKGLGQISGLTGLTQQAVQRDQSLATLFGSQDYCETDDCTSVLSPAAYLCDLLLWLRNHRQGGGTALDVLDARRPDIRHLMLNCPNTDVELPYIDLVNELLADKISPPIDGVSTTYTQKALIDGTTYYYIVTAVDSVGESVPSTEVSATPTAPTVAPTAPTGVAAAPGDGQVTISWNAVAGATSYNLYWATAPGVTPATGTQIAGVTSPFVHGALVNGTTYYYVVTAVNALGESPASAQASASPAAAVAVPAAPTGLAASPGDTQVTLSWSSVAGATSYNVYWATSPGVTPATGARIPGATSPFVQGALINGTMYYYIVTAVNAVGESAASTGVSAAPAVATAVPSAPTGLTATAGDGQVTLSWSAVAGATSYNIYWATATGVTTAKGTEIMGSRNPKWKQTSANKTPADLLAAPEYFNQGAFNALFVANYPFTLPYSSGLDELRTYLQQWKVPLWQLRQALLPLAGGSVPQQAAVAAERFTIPPHGLDLLSTPNFVPLPVAWNTTNPVTDLAPVPAFLQAASISYESLLELLQVWWVQGSSNVVIQGIDDTCSTSKQKLATLDAGFLDRAHRFLRLWNATGYKMWELDLLLRSAAVGNGTLDSAAMGALLSFRKLQDATRLAVAPQLALYQNMDVATHRDPDGSTVESLYAQVFLNPTVTSVAPDPDLAVLPAGGNPSDQSLSDHLPAIQAALGVSAADVTTLISLTTPVTTTLNAALTAAQTSITVASYAGFPAPSFFVSVGTEVLLVTAVSGVGNTMWTVVRGQKGTTAAAAANGASIGFSPLTLPNLSLLYRTATLAMASKLKIPDLISIAQLLSPGAASAAAALGPLVASPAATLAFLKQVKAVQQPSLSLDALTYLLTPPSGPSAGWATTTQMTPADITGTLAAVQQAVQSLPTTLAAPITAAQTTLTVVSDVNFPAPNFFVSIGAEVLLVTAVSGSGNTTWTVVRAQQGTAAAAAANGAAVTPLSANTTLAAAISATQTTITVADATGFPPPNAYVSIGAEILLVTAAGGVGNTTWTVTRGQQNTTATAAPSGATVTPTGANLNGTVIAAVAANAHTATGSGLANDVSAIVLNTLQVPGTTQTLLAVLSDPAFTGSANPITATNFPNQFLAVQLFDKAAVVVRGVRLQATDLRWLLTNAAVYGGLDFTQLPVQTAHPALALQPLLITLLLVQLARTFNAAPPQSSIQTLYDVIGGVASGSLANAAAAQGALATITAWPGADIAALAAALGLVFPADYTRAAAYDALRTLERMAQAAGATGAQLVSWSAVPPDETTAEGLAAGALGVLKGQQSTNAAWLALAPTVMNPLREHRATALQSYLIGQRDSSGHLIYGDTDGLFDYFLIDTQMTSCQVTSRVVQAYIAVQIFVERCQMNLEAPAVVVDLNADDTWKWWRWMKRYRIWEANREVFLYPENWLIETQRPNRTEIYKKLEQEVRQGQATRDYLETVVLNYIDRLDALAHLQVTGTCEDPASGDLYVVARSVVDPPVFYYRTYADDAWSGWIQIPLDIKAHQAVPALYRGRLCLFWLQVSVSNEPQQPLPPAQPSTNPPNQAPDKYVTLAMYFSIFRNGSWSPAQTAKGKLFDKPFFDPTSSAGDIRTVEGLYTIKVQAPAPHPGYGASLDVDVFRLGNFQTWNFGWLGNPSVVLIIGVDDSVAVQIGRAVFDGRFNDLQLSNAEVPGQFITAGFDRAVPLLSHAQSTYGPDAQPLLPLSAPDPNIGGEPGLEPFAGSLASAPADPNQGSTQTLPLAFTSATALEQNVGPLLNTAQIPLRVVGPVTEVTFDPASYFFFQDNRRAYWVEAQKFYWTGSAWSPVLPSNPYSAPYEVRYWFHVFYHPFTRLIWHQLSSGGFDLLYDPNLQQNPDQIDPSGSDVFSFGSNYNPTWRVRWDHDDVTGQDRQFLDFNRNASFSVYNWEIFYHIPSYVAQLLNQNQQFEDAQKWFHYIFNPTLQGSIPVPQRFWIPKPLRNLTVNQILGQQISQILQAVNQGDPVTLEQVREWQANPFNPFLLADLRLGVPYMKSTVMSYLDNIIGWADNLFASQSREALSEATLLYVIASEILGPTPVAITPPQHADESYDQLEPALDAFANALVEIENVIGGAGGGGGAGDGGQGGLPLPQTFYFKIPPNAKLLGYWGMVAGRLFKMRHCQSITGAPLELALFDAPIDPGLLIAAQAAGVDLSSVLSSSFAPLSSYRFTALYSVASDFVNAVRAYGGALQGALEKSDGGALTLLQQTTQQQLLADGDQVIDWQIQQAQDDIAATNQTLALAQKKYDFNSSQSYTNAWEDVELVLGGAVLVLNAIAAILDAVASAGHMTPSATLGVAGFGGTPVAELTWGGHNVGASSHTAQNVLRIISAALDKAGSMAGKVGSYERRKDNWKEAAAEAQIQIAQANVQLDKANLALQIAQQNKVLHQEQIDNLQKSIDFLNDKFTSDSLYDWMAGSLAATYFQSYQLAYQMCKQVERCYQFELGLTTSFIQFGYWDSLHKGLLAGETLNHDLRRMQASYLQQNSRRYEISRFVSLGLLNPAALQQLLVSGACDFTLPESLFDNDYPGHYNRRLTRVSVTVVYPNPGKFDNVKGTLTLTANQVRISTDTSSGYAENPVGSDSRFVYNYAAVPQKIALGNAQDDPGLFVTAISSNLSDQRYVPFENAGAISSWHFEMPAATNEIDVATVGDVILHLYYTALDGGAPLQTAALANNAANAPTAGIKLFSAQNDFGAPSPTVANPYPVTPWQAFLAAPTAPANQTLTLGISASKFPPWTRGKTISVTSLTVLAVAWPPGVSFVLAPQAPLPTGNVTLNPIAGVSEPNVCSGTINLPANTPPGSWSFELQKQGAADFRSLTKNDIADLLLLVNYTAS